MKRRFVISRSPVRFRQVAYFSISYDDDKKASRIYLVFTQLHGDSNIMIYLESRDSMERDNLSQKSPKMAPLLAPKLSSENHR